MLASFLSSLPAWRTFDPLPVIDFWEKEQKERQKRQMGELVEFTQKLLRRSARVREQAWAKADRSSLTKWMETVETYRDWVYDEMIGRLPEPSIEPNVRTRQVLDDALRPWGAPRSRLELGSTTSILAAARRGEGPAVLSALAVSEDIGAGRLVAVPTEDIDLTRSLRAVWLRARPLAPIARRLLNIAVS